MEALVPTLILSVVLTWQVRGCMRMPLDEIRAAQNMCTGANTSLDYIHICGDFRCKNGLEGNIVTLGEKK